MSETVRQQALAYLAHHQVMTLATHGEDGIWAAAVFYVNDQFTLYFLSAGHTRHARHIAEQPLVAATIQEDYADWPQIKGIQLSGRVSQLSHVSRETAITLYRQKYPFLAEAEPEIARALTRVNWYRLEPDRLYFIDNSRGLGHRDQVALP